MRKLKNVLEIARAITSIIFVLLCIAMSAILIIGILRFGPAVFSL